MALRIQQAQLEHATAFGAGDAAELHTAIGCQRCTIDHRAGRIQQLGLRTFHAACLCVHIEARTGSCVRRRMQRDPTVERRRCLPARIGGQCGIAITRGQAGTDQGHRGGRITAQCGGQVRNARCIGHVRCFRQQHPGGAGRQCTRLVGLGADHHQTGQGDAL
ncbi:hypothetical protein D3C81_637000 [compost metagenome]